MSDFSVTPLRNSNVAYVYRMRQLIEIDPIYQRQGEVWSRGKQRLLIDSVINQFDIPKIYFHQHAVPVEVDGATYRYSLVDGRQRLEAIWDFIDNKFPLADDFVFLENESTSAAGKTYAELQAEEDDIAGLFDATSLDIMLIQTSEIELIEEMFSRLNEAVPLNAAEKRNGRGGPLRPAVQQLCTRSFFRERLPFENTRYRHFDLATKFLLFADEGGAADTKKRRLDDFWDTFRQSSNTARAEELTKIVGQVLAKMEKTFVERDRLLTSVGMVAVYFLYFLELGERGGRSPLRGELVAFDRARRLNRFDDEDDLPRAMRRLVEFDRLAQSPNDLTALQYRTEVLRDYLADPSKFA
jgi:hypothetical protein